MAWLSRLLEGRRARSRPLRFTEVIYYDSVGDLPSRLSTNVLAVVGTGRQRKWAIFECPCDRGHQVRLSLQLSHRPRWRLSLRRGLPCLYPSVWVNKPNGCHFWVLDGRVLWSEAGADREPDAEAFLLGRGHPWQRHPSNRKDEAR
jgi:Family of unknown function (DUF6527)